MHEVEVVDYKNAKTGETPIYYVGYYTIVSPYNFMCLGKFDIKPLYWHLLVLFFGHLATIALQRCQITHFKNAIHPILTKVPNIPLLKCQITHFKNAIYPILMKGLGH